MTAKMMIKAARIKGIRYEVHLLNKLEVNGNVYRHYEVGFNYRNWTWAWFTFSDNASSWAIFRNAYNMANGKEDKTRRRGISVKNQLEKGLDLW